MTGDSYEVGDIVRVLNLEEIIKETGREPDEDGMILNFTKDMRKLCGKEFTITCIKESSVYGLAFRCAETGYWLYEWCTINVSNKNTNTEDWYELFAE